MKSKFIKNVYFIKWTELAIMFLANSVYKIMKNNIYCDFVNYLSDIKKNIIILV